MKSAIVFDRDTGEIVHATLVEAVAPLSDVSALVATDYGDIDQKVKDALWPVTGGVETHTALGHVIALLKRFSRYDVLFADGPPPDRESMKVVGGRLVPKPPEEIERLEASRRKQKIESRIIGLDQQLRSAAAQGLEDMAASIQEHIDGAKRELASYQHRA